MAATPTNVTCNTVATDNPIAITTEREDFQVTEDDFTVNIMEEATKEDGADTNHVAGGDINNDNYQPTMLDKQVDDAVKDAVFNEMHNDLPTRYFALRRGRFTVCCIYMRWQDMYLQIKDFDAEYEIFEQWSDALNYIVSGRTFKDEDTNVTTTVTNTTTEGEGCMDLNTTSSSHSSQSKSWNEMIEELQIYYTNVGTTDVPPNCDLGLWVARQRVEYSNASNHQKSILNQERIQKLKELGFYFGGSTNRRSFDQYVADLIHYRNKNGNQDPQVGTFMYKWIMSTKKRYQDYKMGKSPVSGMDHEKCQTLESIGFSWTKSMNTICINTNSPGDIMNTLPPLDDSTSNMTMPMVSHMNDSSPIESPTTAEVGAISIYNETVATSTTEYSAQSEQRSVVVPVYQQRDIASTEKWKDMMEQLKEYKEKHKNINVTKYSTLGRWVSAQRLAYRKYKSGNQQIDQSNEQMNADKIRQLVEIGFDFEKKRGRKSVSDTDEVWDKMYEELKKFKAKTNHCVPPVNPMTPLRRWFEKQRVEYRKIRNGEESSLTTQRMQLLHDIEFQFVPKNKSKSWDERYKEIVEFKTKFGHCKVPRLYGTLGKWVSDQRGKYNNMQKGKKSNMTHEQATKLNDIGMVWSVIKLPPPEKRADRKPWSHRFQELLEFQEQYGHTVVPQHYPVLGQWVHSQRVNYKLMKQGRKSLMTPKQALQLTNIGFTFEVMRRKKLTVRQSLGNPYPHLPLIASKDDSTKQAGVEGSLKSDDRSDINEEEDTIQTGQNTQV